MAFSEEQQVWKLVWGSVQQELRFSARLEFWLVAWFLQVVGSWEAVQQFSQVVGFSGSQELAVLWALFALSDVQPIDFAPPSRLPSPSLFQRISRASHLRHSSQVRAPVTSVAQASQVSSLELVRLIFLEQSPQVSVFWKLYPEICPSVMLAQVSWQRQLFWGLFYLATCLAHLLQVFSSGCGLETCLSLPVSSPAIFREASLQQCS